MSYNRLRWEYENAKNGNYKKMYEVGALAIVRAETLERACEIADGCIEGGVPVMEMSFTLNMLARSSADLRKNTEINYAWEPVPCSDSETARHAVLCGAEFIIAPNYDEGVAKICNRYQIPYAPGCTSITEAVDALSMGAAFIKAFPISDFYGPKLVKVFKTPIPAMPILASGGITLDNLEVWIDNGVDVCGFGGLLTKGTSADIAANAKKIHEIIIAKRNK